MLFRIIFNLRWIPKAIPRTSFVELLEKTLFQFPLSFLNCKTIFWNVNISRQYVYLQVINAISSVRTPSQSEWKETGSCTSESRWHYKWKRYVRKRKVRDSFCDYKNWLLCQNGRVGYLSPRFFITLNTHCRNQWIVTNSYQVCAVSMK